MNSDGVRRKFDRIARLYDVLGSPMEGLSFGGLRRDLLSRARGRVLEVGVGTGRNLPCYPAGVDLTGIDVSPGMLERASAKARALGIRPVLRVMDVERMDFPGGTFDTSVSTFVFCTVIHPRKGLGEIRRVLKRGGKALFLEHVRTANFLAGTVMDLLNPLVVALVGSHINRRTVELIRDAGFEILSDEDVGAGIIRKVTALNP